MDNAFVSIYYFAFKLAGAGGACLKRNPMSKNKSAWHGICENWPRVDADKKFLPIIFSAHVLAHNNVAYS